eukprot:61472-Rhodomonas_salina.1
MAGRERGREEGERGAPDGRGRFRGCLGRASRPASTASAPHMIESSALHHEVASGAERKKRAAERTSHRV